MASFGQTNRWRCFRVVDDSDIASTFGKISASAKHRKVFDSVRYGHFGTSVAELRVRFRLKDHPDFTASVGALTSLSADYVALIETGVDHPLLKVLVNTSNPKSILVIDQQNGFLWKTACALRRLCAACLRQLPATSGAS